MPEYYHVRLAISQYGEQFRAELFTEDLGDTDGDLVKADWDELLRRLGPSPGEDDAREVGREMFRQTLGLGRNRGTWTAVVAQARKQDKGLRLLVDATTDAVRDLPFGLLRNDELEHYLFRGAGPGGVPAQFVRILRRCPPRSLRLDPSRIRLLLAVAEPCSPGSPEFAFDAAARLCELARELPQSMEAFVCPPGGGPPVRLREVSAGPREQWQPGAFEPYCRLTREALRSALEAEFDILHLIAHGRGSGLWVCGNTGKPEALSSEDLGPWCREAKVQMAFLQVCRSGKVSGRGGFGGLAQQLLNPEVANVAAVVASPMPLDAAQSTQSAILFYKNLAEGISPDEALARGRLPVTDCTWAFLELWVRPRALAGTGTRGAFQFVSPYRGLASFKERDADVFRGRPAEIEKLYKMVADEPVVAVVGDSGSGKTSLLQAGLVPKVRREGLAGFTSWRIVLLRPGTQPGKSLEQAIRDLPAPNLDALPRLLKDACNPERPLLIVFDQFEEMFTLCEDEAQRQEVTQALADMAQLRAPYFRLVLGMRSEYLYRAATLPGLHDLIERPWVLSLPGPDAVRAIVAEPAAEYGYRFEGPTELSKGAVQPQSLLQRILADPLLQRSGPSKGTAPLPLLEFALERLWLRAVERGSHEFTNADYDQMEGLAGAIAQHAEEVYQHLPTHPQLGADPQKLAEQIITGLTSSQGTRRPRPRADLENETGKPEEAGRVIDHLVGDRLLTIRSDPNNIAATQVDLAHEVLIDRWDRLQKWLREDPIGRALREDFQRDAERWHQGAPGTPPRSWWLLPRSKQGRRYLAWISTRKPELTEAEQTFVRALRTRIRHQYWILVGGVTAAILVAMGMSILALFAVRKAEDALRAEKKARDAAEDAMRAENRTRQNLYVAETGQAYEALEKGNVQLALDLLDNHLPKPGQQDLRGFEWYYLLRLCNRNLFTLRGHQEIVRSVAFSPDGKLVASSGWDKKVWLWDLETKQGSLVGKYGGRLNALTFSPDGKFLAFAVWNDDWQGQVLGPSGTIILRDLHKKEDRQHEVGKLPRKLKRLLPGGVTSLAFSRDSKTLAVGIGQFHPNLKDTDGNVTVMDVAGWKDNQKLSVPEHLIFSLAFSPDEKSRTLAAGIWRKAETGSAGEIKRWEVATQEEQPPLRGHKGGVTWVSFSPDGQTLASSSWDQTVRLWDLASGSVKATLTGHTNRVWSVAFSPDGKTLASGSLDGTIKIWDPLNGEEWATLRGHTSSVYSVAFSPDGKMLASGSWDKTVQLWDIDSQRRLLKEKSKGHKDWVYSVAFSPDGRMLASGGVDKTVRLWDVDTGNEKGCLNEHKDKHTALISSVAFSPDGRTLASGSWDKTVILWNVAKAEPLWQSPRHGGKVRPVAFSPDGKTLASGSEDKKVKFWDVDKGEAQGREIDLDAAVNALAFRHDGKILAIGTGDRYAYPTGRVILWDTVTQKEDSSLPVPTGAVTALAFSPDGKQLAFWSARFVTHDSVPGELALWDLDTGQKRVLQQHIGSVSSLAFSPDGLAVASGGGDQVVRLWDLATQRERAALKGHTDRVMAVAFAPNGRTLATASIDQTVKFWRAADDEDVVQFYKELGESEDKELAERESSDATWRVDFVLASWGLYNHLKQADPEKARQQLQRGLDILQDLHKDSRLSPEQQKEQEAWIAAFEAALNE